MGTCPIEVWLYTMLRTWHEGVVQSSPCTEGWGLGAGSLASIHILEVSLVAQTVLVSMSHCRALGEASCPVSHPVDVR